MTECDPYPDCGAELAPFDRAIMTRGTPAECAVPRLPLDACLHDPTTLQA
jgi:hypothetical protein